LLQINLQKNASFYTMALNSLHIFIWIFFPAAGIEAIFWTTRVCQIMPIADVKTKNAVSKAKTVCRKQTKR